MNLMENSVPAGTVITYGTFDLFHIGHVRLLTRARTLGSRLIVALSTDEFNAQKGKKATFNFAERKLILESCRYVDLVIPEETWEQKRSDILNHDVATFIMGDDWTGKFDFLSDICRVVYLPRTPSISTTYVRQIVREEPTSEVGSCSRP
jgi:glycerol-3-phosphate cytidylyltransferase